jgi:hypothetical protein
VNGAENLRRAMDETSDVGRRRNLHTQPRSPRVRVIHVKNDSPLAASDP